MSNLPPLQLPRAKGRSILQVVGSIGFTLVGLLEVIDGMLSQSFDVRLFIIGLVLPACGFVSFLSVRMFLRPALVVDDRGIWDNTSGLSVRFIPWEQTLGFWPAPVRVPLYRSLWLRALFIDYVAVLWADEQWA